MELDTKVEIVTGTIKRGREIGRLPSARYMWAECSRCGYKRWVWFCNAVPPPKHCQHCSTKVGLERGSRIPKGLKGDRHSRWKGGRCVNSGGYIEVWLPPNHPFFEMADCHHRVKEHRLVLAEKLGRLLLSSENVHHINGIRSDNRPENLQLLTPSNHSLRTEYCKSCELKKEIRLLRWEMKQLQEALQLKLSEGN